jgi:hypothetical protein
VNINSIGITGTDSAEFSLTYTCDASVGKGKSCTITVTFHPTVARGDSGALSVSDNGGGSPQLVPLSGSGCVVYHGYCL